MGFIAPSGRGLHAVGSAVDPQGIPEDLRRRWKIEAEESVFFLQLSVTGYRDAVRFRNGLEVLMQRLREGVRVRVVSLGNAALDADRETIEPVLWPT